MRIRRLQGSGRSVMHGGDGFLLPAEAVVEEVRVCCFFLL